jgi:GT2 family glycosyltransferase
MALIAMAVHDTEENGRSEYTRLTLESLAKTVDWNKHRLFIIDNNSCGITNKIYFDFGENNKNIKFILLGNYENIGTAEAINLAWQHRLPGEHCIKMDNDVVINQVGWVDEMVEAIEREPLIGIVGLKRKDIIQTTWHPDPNYRSELIMLPHEPGQRWINIEKTNDIIGTCIMFNSSLLDKIGYLFQPGLYGYDDVLASHRSHLAGFMNCFLNHIDIDHIDTKAGSYQDWKHKHSGEHTAEMIKIFREYVNGERSIYYNPFI